MGGFAADAEAGMKKAEDRKANGNAKLTEDLARAILLQGREGKSAPTIAKELRLVADVTVSVETIRRVLRGETWTNLTNPMTEEAMKIAAEGSLEKLQRLLKEAKQGDELLAGLGEKAKGEPDAGY